MRSWLRFPIILRSSDCPEIELQSGCSPEISLVAPELTVPFPEGEDDKRRNTGNGRADDDDNDTEGGGFGDCKESKVNSCGRVDNEFVGEVNLDDPFKSNYSYGEAEALTDEMEEESLVLGEVFRINNILLNRREESDYVLFESLRRLQLMGLTVATLKATEIGKLVNQLRKHGSKQIRDLAQTLVEYDNELLVLLFELTQLCCITCFDISLN